MTGKCRLSYVYLLEPKPNDEGKTPKYEVSVIIPKSDKDTIAKIEKAIEAAKQQGKTSKWGGKVPKKLRLPLHDGDDDRDDEAYEDAMYLTARSKQQPVIMNRDKSILNDPNGVYSGMYAALILNFYPYDNESKGVAVGLEAVMKLGEGERLGGSRMSYEAAADAFDGFDFGDEDESGAAASFF
jgi:hypothetical protein